jgi:acyl-CoA thioesterase
MTRTGEGEYAGETDPAYWNLIGPFGGWIAAVLMLAVLDDPRRHGEPLSLSTNFAGAIEAGPYAIRTRNARRNRSTDFWRAELVQHQHGRDVLCAEASLVLAHRRPTDSFVDVSPPEAPAPETLPAVPANAGAPSFLEKYDMRFATGNPFAGGDPDRTVAWVRDRAPRTLDFPALAALCDTGFPPIFLRLGKRVPVSTVTLNAFFHVNSSELAEIGNDFLLSEGRMRVAHNGFFDCTTTMWSRSGRLLATTEQVVYYKTTS